MQSNKFKEDLTHLTDNQILLSRKFDTMFFRISFWEGLQDFPDERAPTTPLLSEWKTRWQSLKPEWMRVHRPKSMATISAQPMSRPPECQPSKRRQASHLPSTRRPMPKEEDASTKMERGRGAEGMAIEQPHQSALRRARHQTMSARATEKMQ